MAKILICLSDDLLLDLEQHCLRFNFTKSELIRDALRETLYKKDLHLPTYSNDRKKETKKEVIQKRKDFIVQSFVLCKIHKVYKTSCGCK